MDLPAFVPGLELSRRFFTEAVRPIVDATAPGLAYDAALIDAGSEVLGYDDAMSRDHHWGPRVTLFLTPADLATHGAAIDAALRRNLPHRFLGYSTSFEQTDPNDPTLNFAEVKDGVVNHRVTLTTADAFTVDYLALAPGRDPTTAEWLAMPQHPLRTVASGEVFHGGLGEIETLRARFAWYPRDVWLYALAAGWKRIAQERAFIGRTGDNGDDLGSRIIAARLARDAMMLAFLMARTWAPYPKWFGRAFQDLPAAVTLGPTLARMLAAEGHAAREAAFVEACEDLATRHNALGLTAPVPAKAGFYFGRPYRVIDAPAIVDAIVAAIEDPALRAFAGHRLIGVLDQFSDSTDMRTTAIRQALEGSLYDV